MMRPSVMMIISCLVLGSVAEVQGDIYVCKQPGGAETYTNQSLGESCRKLENLPNLIPAPSLPADEDQPEPKKRVPGDARSKSTPGGGRQIDPPQDDAILIRDVKAIPNYYSTLGTARYQADMRLTNVDADWTAAQVCVDVHFRDRARTFIDVHQIRCLEQLKPLDDRPFTVIYTGTLPPQLSPIDADAQVSSIKWVK